MELDELIGCVENALECSAIEIDVWELDIAKGGGWERTSKSPNPLYRLTRCLRSAGLLDEFTTSPTPEGRNP